MKTIINRIFPACSMLLIVLFLLQQPVYSLPASTAVGFDKTTIVVTKTTTSKKYKIRIYPNATHEVLFFTASGEAGKVYQLYIFDIEGKLVKQTQIGNKQTTLLTNFFKGHYTFEVFSDDEKIESGTMLIK